jgi:hypothetical protein
MDPFGWPESQHGTQIKEREKLIIDGKEIQI